MCARATQQLRSISHVCTCKERHHPHPTPPPQHARAPGEPEVLRVICDVPACMDVVCIYIYIYIDSTVYTHTLIIFYIQYLCIYIYIHLKYSLFHLPFSNFRDHLQTSHGNKFKRPMIAPFFPPTATRPAGENCLAKSFRQGPLETETCE